MQDSRRSFLKQASATLALSAMLPRSLTFDTEFAMEKNNSIIGAYGDWAADLLQDPASLSYRNARFDHLKNWHTEAMSKTQDCLSAPDAPAFSALKTVATLEHDGLSIELLEWQLSYGPTTKAIFLKPKNHPGPLPGILGLHDHGGNKYLGWRKIAATGTEKPPFIEEHHQHYYGGAAWANELAKRGYAVLVHDTFTFGSRRVLLQDVKGITWGMPPVPNPPSDGGEDQAYIDAYNQWAAEHEHIMSKSLFCAGTTWPGVFLREDQIALQVLASREEVDDEQLGCCGLSGGGLRTVMLGGIDHRIKCAIAVGFMSTWKDFLLHKSFTHTWMLYIPGLPTYLDFPEILGLRVPLPTMVLNSNQDQLFTLSEMHRADSILRDVFEKEHAADRYQCNFYEGEHKFDLEMQGDAFQWFDRWLA